MILLEEPLTQGKRYVREAEGWARRQRALVERLERSGCPGEARMAREALEASQSTLDVRREHLRLERPRHGPATNLRRPSCPP